MTDPHDYCGMGASAERVAAAQRASAWNRVSIGGIEIPALSVSLRDNVAPPALLGRTLGSYAASCTFEVGADMVRGLVAAFVPPHPTDVIEEAIRAYLRSIYPAVVQRGIDLTRRYARRLRRREARRGTIGRRGSRADG